MLTYEYVVYIAITILLHIGVLFFLTKKKPKKYPLLGRHVVVTGGSQGIGLWAAVYCARLGAHVTIIARNPQALEKAQSLIKEHVEHPEVQVIRCKSFDLATSTYQETCDMIDTIEDEIYPQTASAPVHMLVNCAGMAICGTIEETSIEDAHKMMDLNYFGTYYPTRYCLEKMKKQKQGTIVITASQAALMGIYGYGAYSAAKFALRGLAETIAMEASHCGISVTLALPADTDTPGFAEEEKTKPEVTKIISGSGGLANPRDVAIQIINDALSKKFFSVSGVESWVLTILCSGMAPCRGLLLNLLMVITIAPLKFIGQIIQWNFKRIVRNHAEAEQNEPFAAERAVRMREAEEKLKETDAGRKQRPKRRQHVTLAEKSGDSDDPDN
ncbi:3-ketodihydrosphingosine reductase [Bradysia coprophila]|uniref:3-ketodihydrosphingosine reductase n=1 Tax=Bradysia coprophila TaxID=38358 RepID=UPI00187DD9BF|nr:3-ketodihydrosphingosine reductase [Bradysia coprophila]